MHGFFRCSEREIDFLNTMNFKIDLHVRGIPFGHGAEAGRMVVFVVGFSFNVHYSFPPASSWLENVKIQQVE